MDADQLLNALGAAMGQAQLKLDENGCACLVFEGRLAVNLEYDEDSQLLHVYSVVGELPALGREALYAQLLQANLFGAETQGATLAVDALQHEIVLCRSIAVDRHSAQSFASLIEAFVNTTEHWQQRLSTAASPVESIKVAAPRSGAFVGA